VLIVEDHDAPAGIFDHWLVWNIPVNEPIAEDRVPGISGKNGFGKTGYGGPCPPDGAHRYFFKAYALDTMLELPAGSDKAALLEAIEPHTLASGEIVVYYKKSGQAV
jgi:Raf kinase inhibitor-like YbhB/YbcL family protein